MRIESSNVQMAAGHVKRVHEQERMELQVWSQRSAGPSGPPAPSAAAPPAATTRPRNSSHR